MHAAIALFETIASVLGKAARSTISIDANFYNIGGNSLNSIFTITALSDRGYHISKYFHNLVCTLTFFILFFILILTG